MSDVYFEPFPKDTLMSDGFKIRLMGGHSLERAVIALEITDDSGDVFKSDGFFMFNPDGVIDLSEQASISGSYKGVDAKGLFGSLGEGFKNFTRSDLEITLKAYIEEVFITEYKAKIRYLKPNVKVKEIKKSKDKIFGTYYLPDVKKLKRAFICLGGSAGNRPHLGAAILSSLGHPVLALSYFNWDGLTKNCVEVPLEIIFNAKKWLQDELKVTDVGIIGCSKGAELALLSSSEINFNPVVLASPSSHVFQGLGDYSKPKSSWTKSNKPVPYLILKMGVLGFWGFIYRLFRKTPNTFTKVYNKALDKTSKSHLKKIEESRIKSEKIKSNLLMLSGEQDLIWPSAKMSKEIEKNFKSTAKFKCKNIIYADAGHLTFRNQPGLPVESIIGDKMKLSIGGDPKLNQQANLKMWDDIIKFVSKY
jgi:dienelactone hydrolase